MNKINQKIDNRNQYVIFTLACARDKIIHMVNMMAVCIDIKGFDRVNDFVKWFTRPFTWFT